MKAKEVRRDFRLKSGKIVQIIAKGGIITMVPNRPIALMKGYLEGMSIRSLRGKDWAGKAPR